MRNMSEKDGGIMDSKVIDWQLSDDRLHLTILRHYEGGGTGRTDLRWKTPATDEQVSLALSKEMAPKWSPDQDNELCIGRIWNTRRGSWFWFVDKGPPTWWLPRFMPEKWGFRCGWLRVAVSLTWKPNDLHLSEG